MSEHHGGSHASYFLVMAMLPKGGSGFTAISSCYEGFFFFPPLKAEFTIAD